MPFLSETAGILPAKYFKQRYKPDYEVRHNLFEHQQDSKQSNNNHENSIEDGYQADQPYESSSEAFEIEATTE